MKLRQLRLSNFQSFGETPTTIEFSAMTFLLGPNGAGKTAVLQALARMFAFDPSLRRVQRTDFHVRPEDISDQDKSAIEMWIEAEFEFAETKDAKGKHATIPVHFAHMRLKSADGVPQVRFRLTAQLDSDGEIEESLHHVLEVDENGSPTKKTLVSKHDRNTIQVHYLPARRDPTDHISYAASSLLGRALRAANWTAERSSISTLTETISSALAGNLAVKAVGEQLSAQWTRLHKGTYYANPKISFERNEIDALLRHLTVRFTPGHDDFALDFSRLSDGQKSLLYVSLVLAMQAIGRQVLSGNLDAFDREKLRPAVFTLIAMEEPENSLSPHYLGLVVKSLANFSGHHDAQAVVATHAPSLLKRVAPENIRYLRLDNDRRTVVKTIIMPSAKSEEYKFVREAVQAFPELYFSRLVILGEGDSEEIVLPRLLQVRGMTDDESSIAIVPLGGRHVNHFWRLLHGLGIPYVTLLDLDLGRYQGGWGRVRYAAQQLLAFPTPAASTLSQTNIDGIPKWNSNEAVRKSKLGKQWLTWLESAHVFFSSPIDLDFAMMRKFVTAFGVEDDELAAPDADTIAAVLGKRNPGLSQFDADELKYFGAYHTRFKLASKPVAHLEALAGIDDATLKAEMPATLGRMLDAVQKMLSEIPE